MLRLKAEEGLSVCPKRPSKRFTVHGDPTVRKQLRVASTTQHQSGYLLKQLSKTRRSGDGCSFELGDLQSWDGTCMSINRW